MLLVYGPENVTSGASSDLQHATRTARAMVKVSNKLIPRDTRVPNVTFSWLSCPLQNWGYSHKIGPVYLSDREDTISPKKKDEIEDEVRRYVNVHVIRFHRPCELPFRSHTPLCVTSGNFHGALCEGQACVG